MTREESSSQERNGGGRFQGASNRGAGEEGKRKNWGRVMGAEIG